MGLWRLTIDPQMLRAEAFSDIGVLIQDDATVIIERWCRRAIEQQPDARRCHHAVLRDGLGELLQDLGRGLAESLAEDASPHKLRAREHGEQRWQVGWSLSEVVRDYLILRLVLLEYLDETLERPLTTREMMAIGLALDEAINASVGKYARYREEAARQTERLRAEAEQRSLDALQRWQRIFEHAGWGVAVIDGTSHELLATNAAFAEMHGCSIEELEGTSLLELIVPDMRRKVSTQLEAAGNDHHRFETVHVRAGGTPFPVLADFAALRDETDGRLCFAAHFTDITELKQLEESLEHKAQRLEEVDRRKDQFLATLAHELRNPLAPIQNALELMRLAATHSDAVGSALDVTERQVHQLVRLVDDLLDVARISQGKVELRKQIVPLADLVNGAVESTRPLLSAKAHRLETRLPSEPTYVDADPDRVQQVLTNLLNNAAKYTDARGEIAIIATRNADQVSISVRDNGVGIAPELLPKIFDLFTQSDVSVGRAQGGLGIGLTLVRNLVEMHGGSVSVASEGPGKGSQFTVMLPAARKQGEKARMSQPAFDAQNHKPAKILLVDDNKDVVSMLAILLRRIGHEVSIAHDGPEAIATAESEHPEFILLDIGLPGMDGYEVAQRLRAAPELKDAYLVAMTGYGQEEDLKRAEVAGFHHHLLKPVRLETIQAALEVWRKKAAS